MLTRGLLFKGLAAGTALGGLGVAIHQRKNISSLLSPSSSSKEVWGDLKCEGGNCTIESGKKILVKKDNDTPFEVTSLGEGKIKLYKVEGDTYSGGFKFLIEDNDINGTDTNKLEEFESYEIKLGADSETDVNLKGKHYLSRKTESKVEIKKALGLPNESCDLPTSGSQNCTIANGKLGTIRFNGKTGASISGGTVTLTISKESSKTEFPLGYKFTFKNTAESGDATLTIGGTPITLKKDSPVDFKIKKEGSSLSLEKAWTLEELTKKVGLVKDGEEFWDVGGSEINVKLNDSTKKNKITKYSDSQGRIKVYSDQAGYREGLKFTIEKGDLKLMEYNSDGNTSELYLGQFQSFEIVKEENTWYLSRKDEGREKIKNDLGLPCDLPTETATPKECTLSTENIKTIKFDGKGNTDTSFTGSPKLTIYKESGRLDYPLGYKFVFSSTEDASITISTSPQSSITLKKDLSYEYKIKRSGDNKQTLTLEKAWTPESLMVGAAGFAKSTNNVWTDAGEEGISIKQDSNKASSAKANGNKNAKIRVYEEVPGYNQGMKFMVEDGDTDLTNGNNINKLSKYETYEVIKDTDKQWYFNRKKKSDESIRELLGLPQDCSMPTASETPSECTLNDDSKLKAIKFEGKGENEVTVTGSGTVKLKISKETSSTDFPLNYKFTFSSDSKSFTIPKSNGNIEVKKGTNTEFKIKESSNTLTLEKAWTAESLGKKVNLTCTSTGGNNCTFGDNINVWDGDNNYVDEATITNSSGNTLTYEENADDHNQGIKFTVTGNSDINLNTDSKTGGTTKPSTISKKNGDTPTYEIAQKTVGGSTKWYLVKK